MSRFVVDCSVCMAWCFESEADEYTRGVLRAMPRSAVLVPAVWPLEIVDVLLVAERGRKISRADAVRFLDLLGGLPIAVEGPMEIESLDRLLALGREHRLSSYDAAYLDLAMRERLPIATRDRALKAAAQAAGVAEFAATTPR